MRCCLTAHRGSADADSLRLDHNWITYELVRVVGNDFSEHVSFRRVRETMQLNQNRPAGTQTPVNDSLVKIAILGIQNADFENVAARDLADLWSRYHPSGVSAMFKKMRAFDVLFVMTSVGSASETKPP